MLYLLLVLVAMWVTRLLEHLHPCMHADDIVLMSPSVHRTRCMLKLCDEYARDFNVLMPVNPNVLSTDREVFR